MTPDFIEAMVTVSRHLHELGVVHCVGGSVAAFRHGLARSTLDVDFVAQLTPERASDLVRLLQPRFYGDETAAADAARRGSSFNVIEMESGVKVDVFIAGSDPLALSSMKHATPDEHGVPIASAEDTIVSKLRWFRLGGEASERQWRDVLGVLRVAKDRLDDARMSRLATVANVSDLLERANAEA